VSAQAAVQRDLCTALAQLQAAQAGAEALRAEAEALKEEAQRGDHERGELARRLEMTRSVHMQLQLEVVHSCTRVYVCCGGGSIWRVAIHCGGMLVTSPLGAARQPHASTSARCAMSQMRMQRPTPSHLCLHTAPRATVCVTARHGAEMPWTVRGRR
jgi:hypothetical protein